MPVAQLRGLFQRYGDVAALEGVDLEIPTGRMVGVVGPDGVGKSSLLALVAGVRKIQAGTIEVLGGSLADPKHRSAMYSRIAYMPQGLGRNLYATLSVFENVDFFGRLFGYSRNERAERIAELLASTGLTSFRNRPAGKLSGGMKQKLGLCCALIHEPDLLILDEPTTGVDPLSRRRFWRLIERIRARRPSMSVLVATAYMEEAESFDWLVAMDAGKVLAVGSAAELCERTGASSLEDAFVALLPAAKREGHRAIVVPPRKPALDAAPAIEAWALTRRFGDFTAVDRVSFRITRGEIFGFVGSNGCGKTTTMKMLTGLLPASEGSAALFGKPVNARNIETRKNVGYMSQGFSLYGELTVRQNLVLHGQLFQLRKSEISRRFDDLIGRFGLGDYLDALAESLPLGIRQRLSLAVAVIHEPEILILDEPTSGVDPVGRDHFWELLIHLARDLGVTIFVSTHFMNEAARCDRVALMDAGRVLVCDTPAVIQRMKGKNSLEDAFVAFLEACSPEAPSLEESLPAGLGAPKESPRDRAFSPTRMFAYLLRETTEVLRDPIRLMVAFLGPVLLMLVLGYGLNFDVEHTAYAVLDRDNTTLSRQYLENFAGSRYFEQRAPIRDYAELERRIQSAEISVAIEIPPRFAADVKRGRAPEVGVWIDGAMPFHGETMRGQAQGVHEYALADYARRHSHADSPSSPADLRFRYRYNQDFRSINAIVPSVIALLLIFFPSILMALGVVREKELGSITNMYATPVTRLEFMAGKQLPYIGIAMANFLVLTAMTVFLFGVPLKAGFLPLAAGALLYAISTTGIGLLLSAVTRTQVAAMMGTAIITLMPAVQFCGMITPVSSLTGSARVIGVLFPTTYFMKISVGAFTKAVDFSELAANYLALVGFIAALTLLNLVLIKKQDT